MVKLNEFASVTITFVVIAIIIGIGGTVLDEVHLKLWKKLMF